MNGTVIYTAVSGIDEAYLADTENIAQIKAENVKARKRKQSVLVGVCACFLFILGIVGVIKIIDPQKTEPHTSQTDPPAAVGQHSVVPFAAKNDPDADAFGEEEIHQVYLSVQGIRYEQLRVEELAQYGISENIPDSAFGASVGTVVESFPNQETKAPITVFSWRAGFLLRYGERKRGPDRGKGRALQRFRRVAMARLQFVPGELRVLRRGAVCGRDRKHLLYDQDVGGG